MTHPQENRRNWHLDKSVSLSHLITTVTLAMGGAWYIMGMQAQIDIGREHNKYIQEQVKQMQQVLGEGNGPLRRDIDRIRIDLDRVNGKLDLVAERLSQRLPRTRYLKDYQ